MFRRCPRGWLTVGLLLGWRPLVPRRVHVDGAHPLRRVAVARPRQSVPGRQILAPAPDVRSCRRACSAACSVFVRRCGDWSGCWFYGVSVVDEFLAAAVRELGVVLDGSAVPSGAQSAASVRRVWFGGGRGGYLKVTSAAAGSQPLAAARREFRFYAELAEAMPVRTPEVVGGRSDETGVVLLLANAGAAVDPRSWSKRHWSQLGVELAALHHFPLPADPYWDRVAGMGEPDMELAEAFWAGRLPQLARVLAGLDSLREAMTALPLVFAHGDCHTGNVLQAGRSFVFCDWQSAGAARAQSDLAFLSVRATPSGGARSAAVIDAYLACTADDPQLLRRAVVADELSTLLVHWPPYASANDAAGVARIVHRTRALTDLWLTT